MAKFELTKNIEAKKLNKRTGVPTGGPPVTIPYGAIIDDLTEEMHLVKFLYLGEPFQSTREVMSSATTPIHSRPAETAASGTASTKGPASATPPTPSVQWEQVASSHKLSVLRAKVPGGWLVLISGAGPTYYPDPDHQWS